MTSSRCTRAPPRAPPRPGSPTSERSRRGSRSPAAARSSVNALLAPRPLAVAEHELLDLAGRGLGELPELDRLGRLEPGDPRAHVLDDLGLGGALPGLQHHEGL